MKKKYTKSSKDLQYRHLGIHPLIVFVADLFLIIASFVLAVGSLFNGSFPYAVIWGACVIWSIAIIIKVANQVLMQLTRKDFKRMQLSEELSASTLLAQQRINEEKSRSILQITYGHVPEWHPIDFEKNVLVYDVHEQLRIILIEIRNAILNMSKQTDSDMATVDLVYCYPDNKYDGKLPVPSDQSGAWRIITSRDMSCMNYRLHDFLSSNESFFFNLDQNNYYFINDKKNAERYYIRSGKDHEYKDVGSIVGITINVKNDAPEKVLVKAMLTITTYGWNLYEQDSEIKEEEFEELLKLKVLNGYKSLLESELVQMYIRHMVRDGKMCSLTGITILEAGGGLVEPPLPPFTCPLNPSRKKNECPNKKERCKCFETEDCK